MDPYATFYDAVNSDYYKKIGNFFRRHIRFAGKSVLCLASGSGFFPEFYLRNGAKHVTSVDISPDFLRLAEKRLKDDPRRRSVSFVRADMAKFQTAKRYDLVFINGNSFCYLQTQEEQEACLNGIRKHLKPGGRAYIIIVPLSGRMNADFTYKRFGRTESGVAVEQSGLVTVNYDRHRLDFNITWKAGGKRYGNVVRTRIMTVPEFALLVKLSGLRIGRVWGDYRRRIPANSHNRMYELKK